MKNLCFFIKDHQDLDHFCPIINILQARNKIFLVLEDEKFTYDPRLKYIISNNQNIEIEIKPKRTLFFDKVNYLLFKNINIFKLLLSIFKINIFLKIIIFFQKKNIIIRKKIDAIFFDHRPIYLCNHIILIKILDIKVISLPHGYQIFTEKIPFSKTQLDRNLFSKYLVQTNFQKENLIKLDLKPDKIEIIGSSRFSKNWINVIDKIYDGKKYFNNELPTISFFIGHWKYYLDKNKTLILIEKIINLKNFNIFINLHTRGTSELPIEFLKKLDDKNIIINNGKIYASETIKESDIIIGVGTSVILEAITRNKKILYLSYLQSIKTVFSFLNDHSFVNSDLECIEKLKDYKNNTFKNNYKKFYETFIQEKLEKIVKLI